MLRPIALDDVLGPGAIAGDPQAAGAIYDRGSPAVILPSYTKASEQPE